MGGFHCGACERCSMEGGRAEWPAALQALIDPRTPRDGPPFAIGRLGNTIARIGLRGGGLAILKRGGPGEAADDVHAEAARLGWLAGRGGAPRLVWSGRIGSDAASLVRALPGRPAHEMTDHPRHAITSAAVALRAVHAVPIDDCPFGMASNASCVLIHGDFALPNVVVDDASTGVVDWSLATIGDRESDICDAERSIRRNFGAEFVPHFREAYAQR